jgi:hypothetical protein
MGLFSKFNEEKALQECLEALESGEALEAILARYPGYEARLKESLRAAGWLAEHKTALEPGEAFLQASRLRLTARLKTEQTRRKQALRNVTYRMSGWGRQLQAAAVALLVLMVFNLAGQVMYAARIALPGDLVYPVKKFQEQARLAVSLDAVEDARLGVAFTQQRALEIEALILEGRMEDLGKASGLFERQVVQAYRLLNTAAQENPAQALLLKTQLDQALSDQALAIMVLIQSVPRGLRSGLEFALLAAPR